MNISHSLIILFEPFFLFSIKNIWKYLYIHLSFIALSVIASVKTSYFPIFASSFIIIFFLLSITQFSSSSKYNFDIRMFHHTNTHTVTTSCERKQEKNNNNNNNNWQYVERKRTKMCIIHNRGILFPCAWKCK